MLEWRQRTWKKVYDEFFLFSHIRLNVLFRIKCWSNLIRIQNSKLCDRMAANKNRHDIRPSLFLSSWCLSLLSSLPMLTYEYWWKWEKDQHHLNDDYGLVSLLMRLLRCIFVRRKLTSINDYTLVFYSFSHFVVYLSVYWAYQIEIETRMRALKIRSIYPSIW